MWIITPKILFDGRHELILFDGRHECGLLPNLDILILFDGRHECGLLHQRIRYFNSI